MVNSIETTTYKELRHAILYGKIKPDDLLSEASLSKKMGISRTPIRSALKQLEQEGLVNYQKNRGVTLREASVKEMVDITQICVQWMLLAVEQVDAGLGSFDIERIQQKLDEAKAYRAAADYVHYINRMPEVYMEIMKASGNHLLIPTYKALLGRQISTSLYRKMSDPKNAPEKKRSTVLFFQEFVDSLNQENYQEAADILKNYQEYANNQILHYGHL